jgi:hypothetical protein
MRARNRELPPGVGAEHGLAEGLVGIGDALATVPPSLEAAVAAAVAEHGAKAGRMLRRFADLADGAFVWTRAGDGAFFLGRVAGSWRYDDSPAARAVGIHHVRPTRWRPEPFGQDVVPVAVLETFARGGRNLQRIHGAGVEQRTAELWAASEGEAPR